VRSLQARLLNDHRVVDAVPHCGDVRFILQRGCAIDELSSLLRAAPTRLVAPRLEDRFMVLLRSQREFERGVDERSASSPVADVRSDEVLIEVKDLVRRFGDFTAVASTTFSVRRGEIFGLLGPNGAGKTTTFRMLCGLLPTSGGQLRVAGVDLRHASAKARCKIGYVSQKFALYSNLTVSENLGFFGGAYGLYGKRLRERMAEMLRQFQLEALSNTPAGQLTGGLKQRLSMATALLHQPDILFLDEPTSGADPLARREFWRRISGLAAQGTTVVVTTHFMEEAEYCDRIVIQEAGQVLALGTPAEVRAKAGGEDTPIDMEEAFIRIVEKKRQSEKSLPQPMEANG
jgi:ABC-2 type transport system ATP-binding protein